MLHADVDAKREEELEDLLGVVDGMDLDGSKRVRRPLFWISSRQWKRLSSRTPRGSKLAPWTRQSCSIQSHSRRLCPITTMMSLTLPSKDT